MAMPGQAPEASAEVAGKQLEAFFLRRMLAEMRATVGEGMFSGGYSTEMFQNMLDEAMADEMSESGSVGIADVISKELEGNSPNPTGELEMLSANKGALSVQSLSSKARPEGMLAIKPATMPLQKPSVSTLAPIESAIGASHASRAYKAHNHGLQNMPVDARVSSKFGRRIHPVTGAKSFHEGLDLAAPEGSKVGVSGPGIVVRAGKGGTYGNLVIVDHGGGLETRYAHLKTIDVQVGQQLATGESVGKVGSTGRVTGPHLHFEVRRRGKAIDPNTLLSGGK